MTGGSMAAGKLVLLLLVGGLAGAAFAGMTTGVMRPYRERAAASPAASSAITYSTPPARQSWLDEGLSLLDSPAWPFGQGSGDDLAPAPYPDSEGYAPDHYDRRDSYDVDRWQRDDQRGYRRYDEYDDAQAGDSDLAQGPSLPAGRSAGTGTAPNLSRQADAANDAARRAATAAQDVIAAEHAN